MIEAAYQRILQEKGIWKDYCPVRVERLCKVQVSYLGFEGVPHHDGEIVVLDAVAEHVRRIFAALYEAEFPIASIRPIEMFDGDDEASMAANNSSAFNCRAIAGSKILSIHSYGLAIDINPAQNPYVVRQDVERGIMQVFPPQGIDYLNRANQRQGMVEPIVEIFRQHGFTLWGGHWNDPLDWHHFQTPRSVAELLAVMVPGHATTFFEHYAAKPSVEGAERWVQDYLADPDQFMQSMV